MEGDINLVAELAIILISAGVCTILTKWLRQPLILGYIIAGFLVGPHLGLFPQSSSSEAVEQWSEIGIIFLLFALGLEFSFKKLLKVGSSALITASLNCVGLFTIGVIAGNLMGWAQMESVFLGGLLSMSSTTIIIKAYKDMGLMDKPYSSLVFGTLVVEDLLAVLLMVLLSTMALSNKFAGGEMALSLGKLGFYLVLWFVLGIYLIPTFLKKVKRVLTDEILLILAIGLCFGMVALASMAGFSSALGAFVMGSILSETMEGDKISHLMDGIKDLFGAIFFVSVGMMIDPAVIVEHWSTVIIICVIAVVGKVVFSIVGVTLSGNSLDNAVHTGFSLAQLGEFSFIIAGLGVSLGVMREMIYPMIIAVSAITTFTTPYMIRFAGPVSYYLQRKLPSSILKRLNTRTSSSNKSSAEKSEWVKLLKSYGIRIGLYLLLIFALNVASKQLLPAIIETVLPFAGDGIKSTLEIAITVSLLLPLVYGLSISNGSASKIIKELSMKSQENALPLLAVVILRYMLGLACISYSVLSHVSIHWLAVLLIFVIAAALFLMTKYSRKTLSVAENRFISNLNAKEELIKKQEPYSTSIREQLGLVDIHIEKVTVSSDFEYIGQTLREMPFRKETGVNILKIKRGSSIINVPGGGERIFPADILFAVGTAEQLRIFKKLVAEASAPSIADGAEESAVIDVTVSESSFLIGKTLMEVDMRKSRCMVVSVFRRGGYITNPKPDFRFELGDIVWIAGERASCEWYK